MDILRKLTLAYLGILVSALAASLIAILAQLRRIDTDLDQVAQALTLVRDRTATLDGHLSTVQSATGGFGERMQTAAGSLEKADQALEQAARPS
jgi:ABC-type transporter Mla subunit MlaD